jgi:hypothetical protein
MTETSPVIAVNPINSCAKKPAAAGILVSNTEMKVSLTLVSVIYILICVSARPSWLSTERLTKLF